MIDISLLPEFGWSIKNEQVYGPGSVFQGFIKIKASQETLESSDRLRIVFHATETTFSVAHVHPIYHNQLFGSQKILWKRESSKGPIWAEVPFIIQIPMIQFPPSCCLKSTDKSLFYENQFTLSAYLESKGQTVFKVHKPILYMPWIDCFIKQPWRISNTQIKVSLPAVNYQPGDILSVKLTLTDSLLVSTHSISTRLCQIQTWKKMPECDTRYAFNTERKHQETISSCTVKISEWKDERIELKIPEDTLPSFSYSPAFSIEYQLKISLKTKRKKVWSHSVELLEIPLVLGYGTPSSKHIKTYSDYKSVFSHQKEGSPSLPVPRFLEVVEYEDHLPLYESSKLPSYDS